MVLLGLVKIPWIISSTGAPCPQANKTSLRAVVHAIKYTILPSFQSIQVSLNKFQHCSFLNTHQFCHIIPFFSAGSKISYVPSGPVGSKIPYVPRGPMRLFQYTKLDYHTEQHYNSLCTRTWPHCAVCALLLSTMVRTHIYPLNNLANKWVILKIMISLSS